MKTDKNIQVNLCVMGGGAMMVWSSPILLMLQSDPVEEENPLSRPITDEEASWIGALSPVGTLVGCFVPGYLAEKLGRRTTLLSSIIPMAISWVLVFTRKSIGVLYAARFIGGLAVVIPFGVIPVYCGEIAETSIRGILGSFFQIFITLGLLWAYSIGPFVSYMNYCIACAVLPITFFISFYPMPESPYYWATKSRKEDVIRVLMRLRGKKKAEVEKEAAEIEVTVQEAYSKQASKQATILDLFKVKANLKALIATCALGILGLFFYLKDAAGIQVSHVGWLPIFSLVTFMATYSIGLSPIPWTIIGEMFSHEVKSTATTIIVFTCCFLSFIISKYFINMVITFGQYTTMWFFGFFCILSLLFVVLFLPETKGKSLQEIQDEVSGKARK
ncbi:hypothetical protein G9C98_006808 [Cotesia typhae]|uniref:Major facilitator superfamily (MFS) profile domain-containing protein n=1 Tax=Cotesia typhae TaxID=2053667 RepID=A0A8J5QWI3_9HYME|nr:hypothetical protein G9C98_006808 [Cotesia typhae]